jgi:xanthine/CO dehydrogenase XdhC/CoxF family maturation factor
VSGGCLERDVARIGRIVIDTGEPQVSVYETAEEGDEDPTTSVQPGPSLGCGGRIEILIERVSAGNSGILAAMSSAVRRRTTSRIATIVRNSHRIMLIDGKEISNVTSVQSRGEMLQHLKDFSGPARTVRIQGEDVLLESIAPPRSLFIYGDGRDVEPMVELAKSLGWRVTICAPRSAAELRARFATADEHIVEIKSPPTDSAVVVMNHNLRRDAAALAAAVRGDVEYIGILGPRRRSMRLLESLGDISPEIRDRIFAPVGLDIGAQTPEQIALAVIAEICAVRGGHGGASLRTRPGAIHEPASSWRI